MIVVVTTIIAVAILVGNVLCTISKHIQAVADVLAVLALENATSGDGGVLPQEDVVMSLVLAEQIGLSDDEDAAGEARAMDASEPQSVFSALIHGPCATGARPHPSSINGQLPPLRPSLPFRPRRDFRASWPSVDHGRGPDRKEKLLAHFR